MLGTLPTNILGLDLLKGRAWVDHGALGGMVVAGVGGESVNLASMRWLQPVLELPPSVTKC